MAIIGLSGKMQSGKDTVAKIIQLLDIYYRLESKSGYNYEEFVIEQLKKPDFDASNLKWQNKKFATKLKQICSTLFDCTLEDLEDNNFKNRTIPEEFMMHFYRDYENGIVEVTTKERYEKEGRIDPTNVARVLPTYREMLQYIGTELFRNNFNYNTWVLSLFNSYVCNPLKPSDNDSNWIISDVRFFNEMDEIKKRHGILIKVERENHIANIEKILEEKPDKNRKKLFSELNFFNDDNLNEPHASELDMEIYEDYNYVIDNNFSINLLIERVKSIMIKEKIIGY